MSRNVQIFSDIFEVSDVDPQGKKFDRVSRLNATSESADMDLILDINSEIYPMSVTDKFTLTLASSLSLSDDDDMGMSSSGTGAAGGIGMGAAGSEKKEVWRDVAAGARTLADDYEYVMYGKVYKYDESGGKNKTSFYASFGGLLLCMSGDPVNVAIGQELYLLIRKN